MALRSINLYNTFQSNEHKSMEYQGEKIKTILADCQSFIRMNALSKFSLTPFSLQQMALFAKHLSKSSVERSKTFLSRDIPIRLSRQYEAIHNSEIYKLGVCSPLARYHDQLAEMVDWKTSQMDLQEFAKTSEKLSSDISSSVFDISSAIHDWIDSQDNALYKYHKHINELMDFLHLSVISIRTPIQQYNSVIKTFLEENKKDEKYIGIINPNCNTQNVIKNTIEDAKDLCIEKNGEAPSVQMSGGGATMCCVEAHLHFINAMKATLQTKNKSPIQVSVTSESNKVIIEIKDTGQGITQENIEKIFWYFYSTTEKMEPTYTYSGLFGAPFDGLGCGLSIARVYSRYMGGAITIHSGRAEGTTASITLNKHGHSTH